MNKDVILSSMDATKGTREVGTPILVWNIGIEMIQKWSLERNGHGCDSQGYAYGYGYGMLPEKVM